VLTVGEQDREQGDLGHQLDHVVVHLDQVQGQRSRGEADEEEHGGGRQGAPRRQGRGQHRQQQGHAERHQEGAHGG